MNIMKKELIRFVVMASFLLPFNEVGAALISVDDSTFGIGSLTVDTSTNLAWLDLSITKGISFNDITNELNYGGTYSGYRFASPDEVFSLFVQAQIPDINATGSFAHYGTSANAAPALSLINLMGPSYQIQTGGVLLSEIAGFSSQHVTLNGFDLIQMPYAIVREGIITQNGAESFGEVFTTGSSILPSRSYEGAGSWLVKSVVVTEPPVIGLFISGVCGLFCITRRKPIRIKASLT